MSATTLVLAVVVVILLYLLFKKYASAAPTTEQIRSESQSSMIDENREESVQPNEGDKKLKNQVESGEQKRKTDLEDNNNNNNGKSMVSEDSEPGKVVETDLNKDESKQNESEEVGKVAESLEVGKEESEQDKAKAEDSSGRVLQGDLHTGKAKSIQSDAHKGKGKSDESNEVRKVVELDLHTGRVKSEDIHMGKGKSKEDAQSDLHAERAKPKERADELDLHTGKVISREAVRTGRRKSKEVSELDLHTGKAKSKEDAVAVASARAELDLHTGRLTSAEESRRGRGKSKDGMELDLHTGKAKSKEDAAGAGSGTAGLDLHKGKQRSKEIIQTARGGSREDAKPEPDVYTGKSMSPETLKRLQMKIRKTSKEMVTTAKLKGASKEGSDLSGMSVPSAEVNLHRGKQRSKEGIQSGENAKPEPDVNTGRSVSPETLKRLQMKIRKTSKETVTTAKLKGASKEGSDLGGMNVPSAEVNLHTGKQRSKGGIQSGENAKPEPDVNTGRSVSPETLKRLQMKIRKTSKETVTTAKLKGASKEGSDLGGMNVPSAEVNLHTGKQRSKGGIQSGENAKPEPDVYTGKSMSPETLKRLQMKIRKTSKETVTTAKLKGASKEGSDLSGMSVPSAEVNLHTGKQRSKGGIQSGENAKPEPDVNTGRSVSPETLKRLQMKIRKTSKETVTTAKLKGASKEGSDLSGMSVPSAEVNLHRGKQRSKEGIQSGENAKPEPDVNTGRSVSPETLKRLQMKIRKTSKETVTTAKLKGASKEGSDLSGMNVPSAEVNLHTGKQRSKGGIQSGENAKPEPDVNTGRSVSPETLKRLQMKIRKTSKETVTTAKLKGASKEGSDLSGMNVPSAEVNLHTGKQRSKGGIQSGENAKPEPDVNTGRSVSPETLKRLQMKIRKTSKETVTTAKLKGASKEGSDLSGMNVPSAEVNLHTGKQRSKGGIQSGENAKPEPDVHTGESIPPEMLKRLQMKAGKTSREMVKTAKLKGASIEGSGLSGMNVPPAEVKRSLREGDELNQSSASDEQNLNVKNGDNEVRKRNMKGAGKGGGSKEWGPMGKQKMRDVPPWKMEGDVYFPPNFWIEEKRSKQSDRQL